MANPNQACDMGLLINPFWQPFLKNETVPLKLSSPAEFMINFFTQNLILLLVLPHSPQDFDLRSIEESRGLELSELRRALPCTKALPRPVFLVCRKRLQSPSSSLSSKGQIQAVTN